MSEPVVDLAEARARQEEELESLRLIYSDEFVSTHADAEESGVTVVQVKLGKSKGEEADGGERLVTLRAYLGPEYPLGPEMPLFELRGVNWSRRDQNAVYEGLWMGRDRPSMMHEGLETRVTRPPPICTRQHRHQLTDQGCGSSSSSRRARWCSSSGSSG